jgi:hypothetical protein
MEKHAVRFTARTFSNSAGGSRDAGAWSFDAGVVDQHVDPSEAFHRGFDHVPAVVGYANVGGNPAAARLGHLVEGGLQEVRAAGGDHDVGARLRACLGESHTQGPEDAPVMTTTLLSRRKRSGSDWAVAVAVADRADIVLVMMV